MKTPRPSSAFTLIELLVVIAIIGVLSAIVAPTLSNFRKGDTITAATSQLLGGVARARQLAMSQRSDVYMVFLPTNYFASLNLAALTPAERVAVTNLADKPLSAYNFVSVRRAGDQPGQSSTNYLGRWQQLPEGIFIPPEKFFAQGPTPNYIIPGQDVGEEIPVYGFVWRMIPFPTENSPMIALPCMIFNYQGRLLSRPPNQDGENIPLAQGSVLVPRDGKSKEVILGVAEAQENPPGNSRIGYNVVHVDWLTGRGHLQRRQIR